MSAKSYQLQPDTILDGRYKINRVLGEGGFGITYDAENQRLGMRVAIKEFFCRDYMNRDTGEADSVILFDQEMRVRFEKEKDQFLKEARVLRDFSNEPGVVHVVDYFEANNTAYIVMNFLDGVTLREYVRKNGRMDPEEIGREVKPLLKTLKKIHDAGLIHRDISPDNIILTEDGRLVLIDFGAAYRFDKESRSYTIIGKNGYTAPEQYSAEGRIGPEADIYALSATVFYCLSASDPESSLQRLYMQSKAQSLASMGIAVPEEIDRIVSKGLSVKAADRFPDADAMFEAVDKVYPDLPPKPSRKKRILGGAAIVIAAIAALVSVYLYSHRVELKLRKVETESFWLTAKEDATVQQYDQASHSIREWFEVFAGKDNFLWIEQENETKVIFPREVLCNYDPAYICRKYLRNPEKVYLVCFKDAADLNQQMYSYYSVIVDQAVIRKEAIPFSREYIKDAKVEEGELPEIDRETFSLPESGNYKYLILDLTEEGCQAIEDSFGDVLKKKNWVMHFCYGILSDNRDVHDYCISNGDGHSVSVIIPDQDGTLIDARLFCLTHESWADALDITEDWVIRWEDTASGIFTGEFQCNYEQLEDNCMQLLCSHHSGKLSKSELMQDMAALKERLDALEIPYSVGTKYEQSDVAEYDSDIIAIAVQRDSMKELEIALLLNDGWISLKPRIMGAGTEYAASGFLFDAEDISFHTRDGVAGIEIPVSAIPKSEDEIRRILKVFEDAGMDSLVLKLGLFDLEFARVSIDQIKKTLDDGYIFITQLCDPSRSIENLERTHFPEYLEAIDREYTSTYYRVPTIRWIQADRMPQKMEIWEVGGEQFASQHGLCEEWRREFSDTEHLIITEKLESAGYTVDFSMSNLREETIADILTVAEKVCSSESALDGRFRSITFNGDLESGASLQICIKKSGSEYKMEIDAATGLTLFTDSDHYSSEEAQNLCEKILADVQEYPHLSKVLAEDFKEIKLQYLTI